jgi:sortase B
MKVKIFIAVCTAAAVIAAFFLGRYLIETYRGERLIDEIRPQMEEGRDIPAGGDPQPSGDPNVDKWRKLRAENADFVFWLKVPGTKVDYPVMQRKGSPEYYLHRNFKGENSAAGTPFLASICDPYKPSDNLIIYGHHMRSGAMFATLTKLTSKSFYEQHSEIDLLTKDGLKKYTIISVFRTQVGAGAKDEFRYYEKADFADEADFSFFIENAKSRAYYETDIPLAYGNKLITLSTCEYTAKNGRLVVVGVLDL